MISNVGLEYMHFSLDSREAACERLENIQVIESRMVILAHICRVVVSY